MEGNMNNVQRDPFSVGRDADMRQLMTSLRELQEIISNAQMIWGTGRCMLDKKLLMDHVDLIARLLPDSVKQAAAIVKDEQNIRENARRESTEQTTKAREEAQKTIDEAAREAEKTRADSKKAAEEAARANANAMNTANAMKAQAENDAAAIRQKAQNAANALYAQAQQEEGKAHPQDEEHGIRDHPSPAQSGRIILPCAGPAGEIADIQRQKRQDAGGEKAQKPLQEHRRRGNAGLCRETHKAYAPFHEVPIVYTISRRKSIPCQIRNCKCTVTFMIAQIRTS